MHFINFIKLVQTMRSYRPPRILTQADVVSSPPNFRNYEKSTTESAPNKLQSEINNPQTNNHHKERYYKKSVSQMNLNSGYFLETIKPGLMKNILKDSYSSQIKRQRDQKVQQKKRRIMEERDYLSRFHGQNNFQSQQKKKANAEYKRELLQSIQAKQIFVNQSKTEETSLQKLYQQPRLHNLEHKSQSFRRFYDQAQQFQNKVANQYRGYMAKEQDYIRSRNKDKIIDYQPNYELMLRQRLLEIKMREERRLELRKVLDQQVQKNQRKRQILLERPNSKIGREGGHDPIVNPIDYKLDIRNKYVLGELLKQTISPRIAQ